MITIATGHSVRPKIALAAAALACAGLAACSSSGGTTSAPASSSQPAVASQASSPAAASASSAPAAASGDQPCGLVTTAEVTAAMGKPMNQGPDGEDICVYRGAGDSTLLVYVQSYADTHAMALVKEIEPASKHLPGLGDDAFWTTDGALFVQKGTRGFLITILSMAGASGAPPAIVKLATQALGRF